MGVVVLEIGPITPVKRLSLLVVKSGSTMPLDTAEGNGNGVVNRVCVLSVAYMLYCVCVCGAFLYMLMYTYL